MKRHHMATAMAIVVACCGILWSAVDVPAADTSVDVTRHVEVLGVPYQTRYTGGPSIYARNIWDLCPFRGELLIGGGNSSNEGPASNAGPVPVMTFSPATGKFQSVFTVSDEQIDGFRVLGGKVYIPGHDPQESWALGNFYRLEENGKWQKYRNIPNGIHNYDMAMLDGVLFAGLGTQKGAMVAVSKDQGKTWTNVPAPGGRVYSLMVAGGEVYAGGMLPSDAMMQFFRQHPERLPPAGISQYDKKGAFRARDDLTPAVIFPQTTAKSNQGCKITRTGAFKGHGVYLGAACHNDHQFIPFGAYVATSLVRGRVAIHRIGLPADARPWDLFGTDEMLYVVWERPGPGGTQVHVSASRDGLAWTDLFHFQSKTFARAVAIMDDDFYFGLGCEVKDSQKWTQPELLAETGQLLRVKKPFWKKTSPTSGK